MKKFLGKISTILFIAAFFGIILIVANLIAYALLRLGGLHYESVKELFKFALWVNLISLPVEILFSIVPGALRDIGKIKDKNNVIIYLANGIITSLIIGGVDFCMTTIHVPIYTTIIVSMGFSLLEMILTQKKII